jgi:hypothetical protein
MLVDAVHLANCLRHRGTVRTTEFVLKFQAKLCSTRLPAQAAPKVPAAAAALTDEHRACIDGVSLSFVQWP